MLNIELTCASCADRLPSATQGKTILTLLVAIIVFSFPVRAQSTFAAVAGSVRNESGIAVPDVVITLTDLDTNAMRTAVSSVRASATGFPASRRSLANKGPACPIV